MQIGIIGTGNVGSALADGFSSVGHNVSLGSRTPETASVEFGGEDGDSENIEVVGQREATEYGDVVVLALPARVVTGVASELSDQLAGKTVIDTSNEYPTGKSDKSLAERVGNAVSDADVVKAFNTVGAEHMKDPVLDGDTATMFIAGDDPESIEAVEDLASDLGFEVVVAGGLSSARRLEELGRLWIDLSREYGRDIAFRLVWKK